MTRRCRPGAQAPAVSRPRGQTPRQNPGSSSQTRSEPGTGRHCAPGTPALPPPSPSRPDPPRRSRGAFSVLTFVSPRSAEAKESELAAATTCHALVRSRPIGHDTTAADRAATVSHGPGATLDAGGHASGDGRVGGREGEAAERAAEASAGWTNRASSGRSRLHDPRWTPMVIGSPSLATPSTGHGSTRRASRI